MLIVDITSTASSRAAICHLICVTAAGWRTRRIGLHVRATDTGMLTNLHQYAGNVYYRTTPYAKRDRPSLKCW